MSRLTTKAPQSVTAGGVDYPINTDTRTCLITISAIESNELFQWEKYEVLIKNMYGIQFSEFPQEHLPEAVEKALWFLSGGEKSDGKDMPKICDFDKDADMIYAAFLKSGIDLDQEDMHWWKFRSLFGELPESQFTRVVYLRDKNQKGKLTKEDRQECNAIGWDVINMTDEKEFDEMLAFLRGE